MYVGQREGVVASHGSPRVQRTTGVSFTSGLFKLRALFEQGKEKSEATFYLECMIWCFFSVCLH